MLLMHAILLANLFLEDTLTTRNKKQTAVQYWSNTIKNPRLLLKQKLQLWKETNYVMIMETEVKKMLKIVHGLKNNVF